MTEIVLEKDIIVYQFDPDPDKFVGVNITAIFNDDRYMLIDAGYEHQIKEILLKLDKSKCDGVIITHFHPDHCFGLFELETDNIIGSKHAFITLKVFEKEREEKLIPTTLVEENYSLHYGNHTLTIMQNSGHSIDSTITLLDDKYIFCGDELMFTNDGQSVIPYLADNNPMAHERSLKKLIEFLKNRVLIPGHGKIFKETELSDDEIKNRLIYLEYVKDKVSYDVFEKETNIKFVGRVWHEYNI